MLFYSISKFFDHPYREDLAVKITFITSVLINLLIWVVLYLKIYPLSYLTEYGQIFLHYNTYFGIDKIGPWYQILFIPALGLFIIIFNNIISYIFYLRERLISYSLIIANVALQVILLAAAIFIVLLNI